MPSKKLFMLVKACYSEIEAGVEIPTQSENVIS